MSTRDGSKGARLVLTVPVNERFERASQLGRQVVLVDRMQQGNGRLVGFQLCDAARAGGKMPLQIRVYVGRQMMLDEVREQPDEIVATPFLRHNQSSAPVRGLRLSRQSAEGTADPQNYRNPKLQKAEIG